MICEIHWSEIIKNLAESAAVLGGLWAVWKWLRERHDRATDVLLKLEQEFKLDKVMAGRRFVEDQDYSGTERSVKLDDLLRFYVVLYGVLEAKQVPERSLSICFRYWLAHYFRKDREGFRAYVDNSYPTLKRWLRQDCKKGCDFFRPERLFGAQTDKEFIKKCHDEPSPNR